MNSTLWHRKKMGKFTLRYRPYTLELRHVFTVASFSRSTTPVVLIELEYDGLIGYGEASMPPYLGESQESVIRFLENVSLADFPHPWKPRKSCNTSI